MQEQSYQVRTDFIQFVRQANLPNSDELNKINKSENLYLNKLLYHSYRDNKPSKARKYLLKYIFGYKDYKLLKAYFISFLNPNILKGIRLVEV
jgi:hypothetical protein